MYLLKVHRQQHFLDKTGLFQDPEPKVDDPPPELEVEHYWKGIHETTKSLQADTPALIGFKNYYRNIHLHRHESLNGGDEKRSCR